MDNGFVTVANSSFAHNSAEREGGVFYMDQHSRAKIDRTTLHGNTANKNGGVIQMYRATIEITNGQCHNNSVMHDGGVISASESTSKISGCFESNYAANDGGVIHA